MKPTKKKKPPSTPDRKVKSVETLLKKVRIADDKMQLPFHVCQWDEALDLDDITTGINVRWRRVTCDVLLCRPTTLDQIKAGISTDQTKVSLEIDLPKTFVSTKRTAVRLTDASQLARGVAAVAAPQVIERAQMGSCVQGHATCLVDYKKKTDFKIKMEISLPCKVDPLFTRRNDCGHTSPHTKGIAVATYQHEDALMQAAGQHVHILHLEMTASERVAAGLQSPGGNIDTYQLCAEGTPMGGTTACASTTLLAAVRSIPP